MHDLQPGDKHSPASTAAAHHHHPHRTSSAGATVAESASSFKSDNGQFVTSTSSNRSPHPHTSRLKQFDLDESKSRDFTFYSEPSVHSSTIDEHRQHVSNTGESIPVAASTTTTAASVASQAVPTAVASTSERINNTSSKQSMLGDATLTSTHTKQQRSSNGATTISELTTTSTTKNINGARHYTLSGLDSAASSLVPSGGATRPSASTGQSSFEIIQIVPPTSRRNSQQGAQVSPIMFRSTPQNRRFASTHFRSIPELTNAHVNLHRSEQFQASASYALAHCNEEILCYYNRLVSLIGWRPLINPASCRGRVNWLIQTINWLYVAIIIVMLLCAYLLQFAACFRQDSMFVYDPLILGGGTPPLASYFERNSTKIPPSTTVSWLFRSPNSTLEEFPVVTQKTTAPPTTTTRRPTPTISTRSTESFAQVTFHGKIFPILVTSTPDNESNSTVGDRIAQHTMKMLNDNLKNVFYPFIERYSNVSFHNSTPQHSHHHDHLYRCRGGIGTYYIIPSLLHFIAFISMLRQMRRPETDRFHNLCVVNYILDTKVSGRDRASNKLTSSIRFWMLVGIVCFALTMFSHIVHLFYLVDDPVCYTFLQPTTDTGVNVLKASSLFLFGLIDFVCIAIFTTYALHCTLNIHFLKTNITALREKRIDFHEFAKNTEESKTSIDFLNCTHSIGVSILLVHFGTRLLVLLIDLCSKRVSFNLLTATAFIYWIALVIVPMIQAARVTESCIALRHIGHELRARPYCYQTAPYHDLDSLLNYTSTLYMRAKLLLIPVRSSCVATIGLTLVFVFLILGQIDLIQF